MTRVIYSVYPEVNRGEGLLSDDGQTIVATGSTADRLDRDNISLSVDVEFVHEYEITE